MDFLDDEAQASSSVLVPSSQSEQPTRPRKRRRVGSASDQSAASGEDDYDLPPQDATEGKENKKSKWDERIHVPAGQPKPDTFVTQLTQQYSSPSRIRGPRWMKPQKSLSPSPSPPAFPAFARVPVRPELRTTNHVSNPARDQPVPTLDDEFEVDDDLELLAVMHADNLNNGSTGSSFNQNHLSKNLARRQPIQKSNSFRQTTLHGINTTQQEPARTQTQSRAHNWPLASRNEDPTHHEIDREAMASWVYPTNLGTLREYQYNIVHKALYHNILVALPTGLGKTFIAATVMLNWYRWTKTAKIIFVAPSKPLVSQQVDACFNIAGIPRSQTTMLTGEVSPAIRAEEWQEKRVFFMTPQTLVNDLKSGYCDPKQVVLIVVDEAHRATGGYAYVEVVTFMRRFNPGFRVLALTATPGKNVEKVQEVMDGLAIARVEIRSEESLDIRQYVHKREVEKEVFDFSEEMTMVLEQLATVLQPLLNTLVSRGAAWGKDPTKITAFGLMESWGKWQKSDAGRHADPKIKGMVKSVSSTLMSIAHNIKLLKFHGMIPFYHKMEMFIREAGEGRSKWAKQVINHETFKKMMNRLALWINNPDFEGHPKLTYLKTVVLNHFMNAEGENTNQSTAVSNTRVMVFAQYRDSAEEIVRILKRYAPMIRPHVFNGQSSTKGGSEGMNQKTQLDIIQKFKAGTYNTLVATSIGEEGLDIGEIDLIVCYDCSKSPISMLQRMGRTGRKRAGNIVLLMMREKEEQDFKESEDNYQKMQAKIAKGAEFKFHDDLSRRIVPKDINPIADQRVVEIPIENTQPGSIVPTRRKAKSAKKPAKKFNMPDGVETGFAFLGNGKKTSKTAVKEKKAKARKIDEVASLPSVESVLLSPAEEQQLEDRYVRLAGDEDEYVRCVRLDVCPEQLRRLNKTSSVKHSVRTKMLVKANKAMRISGRDWTRPIECANINEDLCLGSDTDDGIPSRPSAKKPHRKSRKAPDKSPAFEGFEERLDPGPVPQMSSANLQTPTASEHSSGTLRSSSVGAYDENDSFIDDGDQEDILNTVRKQKSKLQMSNAGVEDDLSSIASLQSPVSPPAPAPNEEVGVPYRLFATQESIDYDAMDDELPGLDDLFSSTKRGKGQSGKRPKKNAVTSPSLRTVSEGKEKVAAPIVKGRKRPSRVLDSSDDDE